MIRMIKFANIIPLIGGMSVANKQATGVPPEFFVTWPAFGKNESHVTNYMPDVPYHILPEDGDIIELKEGELPTPTLTETLRERYYGQLDFVSSVCPCAGLSMLNQGSQGGVTSEYGRGSDAPQNDWMYKSSEWVFENLSPKVLWGENAPGLYTKLGEGVRSKLKEIANKYGYSFSIVKTDTHLHGIPQHRRRTFYFFWKSKNAPLLEWSERKCTDKNLIEYLKEIPEDAAYQDDYFTKNSAKSVSSWKLYEFVLEKSGLTDAQFRRSYIGGLYHYVSNRGWVDEAIVWLDKNYPEYKGEEKRKLRHIRNKLAVGLGYWDSSPFFVHDYTNAIISKNMTCIVHPVEDRFLNMRECMHLMGLPHDFELNEENLNFNHIAQNVPVSTAKYYTEQVMKFVKGELIDSGNRFIMQNNSTQKVTTAQKTFKRKKKFKNNPII